jgi:membrane protein implicated in regulation of membrane protease activity
MLRRHLNTIVYSTLLIAAALPYGVFVGLVHAPMWLSLVLCGLTGVVIAVVVEPVSRAIVHRVEDRALVRSSARGPGDSR